MGCVDYKGGMDHIQMKGSTSSGKDGTSKLQYTDGIQIVVHTELHCEI